MGEGGKPTERKDRKRPFIKRIQVWGGGGTVRENLTNIILPKGILNQRGSKPEIRVNLLKKKNSPLPPSLNLYSKPRNYTQLV